MAGAAQEADLGVGRRSHADKRRAWRCALLGEKSRAVLRPGVTDEEIQPIAERLLGFIAFIRTLKVQME